MQPSRQLVKGRQQQCDRIYNRCCRSHQILLDTAIANALADIWKLQALAPQEAMKRIEQQGLPLPEPNKPQLVV